MAQLPRNIENAIKAADPNRIADFLTSQGWQRQRAWRERGFDWVTPKGETVLVPTDPNLQHYTYSLQRIFEMFLAEELAFEDIVSMAANASSDIIRRKIDDSTTRAGSCSLRDLQSSIIGLKGLLSSSSKRFAMKSRTVQGLAKSYLEQCRAGQTEIGSYVLRFYTPVLLSGMPLEWRSFGRRATIAAVENVQYLADDNFSAENPLPPQMDWHVAESVLQLKADEGLWGQKSTMTVNFIENIFATRDDAVPPLKVVTIPMTHTLFERAEVVFNNLRNADMFERMSVIGHITDLHKDAPNNKVQ